MKIIYENYELISENLRFNLIKHTTGLNKDKQEIAVVKDMGYSMTFETCLKRIAEDIMEEKEQVFSISEYIKEYKSVCNILINALKP